MYYFPLQPPYFLLVVGFFCRLNLWYRIIWNIKSNRTEMAKGTLRKY